MIYREYEKYRAMTTVDSMSVEQARVPVMRAIENQLARNLSEKIWEELNTKKSIIVSLVVDKEVTRHDNFTSIITSDIRLVGTRDLMDRMTKRLNNIVTDKLTTYRGSQSDYMQGVTDVAQLFYIELQKLHVELGGTR